MEEKRKYQRVKIIANIIVKLGLGKHDAISYNISLGGVNFVTSQIYETDEKCKILFNCGGTLIEKSGSIKWRKYVNAVKDMINYGFEFDTILSDAEFEKIYKSFLNK